MKTKQIKLKDIKKCINANNENKNTFLLGTFISNRQNTQNEIMLYRKTFLVMASIYFMIYLTIFDSTIIGVKFNEDITQTRAFGFNNLVEFIQLLAPIIFTLLYFFLALSLIHRSILNRAC